jgi:NAD(P)-dependent dehydrogenase (short-subunit alcohol dehydrogenase family)
MAAGSCSGRSALDSINLWHAIIGKRTMNTRRLEGRVALVFGAGCVGEGWGNGKATAVQYARDGAHVVAIDINGESAKQTADIITSEGNVAWSDTCDVTDAAQVDAVVARAEARSERIDILHNNVGVTSMGPLADFTDAQWNRDMDHNVRSVLHTCRRVVPIMLRQGRGVITNISSIAAIRFTGYPYPAYYASKAGVNQLTVAIAMEHASRGIRANVIMPGLMDTPHIYAGIAGQYASAEEMVRQRAALCPMGRMGTGWDIAKAAAFLASDDAQYITGVCLPVDGGITCRI